MNVLGVVVFALLFGYFLSANAESADIVIRLFDNLDKVIMKIMKCICWFVCALALLCTCARQVCTGRCDVVGGSRNNANGQFHRVVDKTRNVRARAGD